MEKSISLLAATREINSRMLTQATYKRVLSAAQRGWFPSHLNAKGTRLEVFESDLDAIALHFISANSARSAAARLEAERIDRAAARNASRGPIA